MLFGILQNEFDDNHKHWMLACKKFNQEYQIIDLTRNNWLDLINNAKFDAFLSCPSARESIFKKLYDERIYIINKVMNKFVYPDFNEISIHENKKYFSYWLKANDIPHPKTDVFYYRKEAMEFIENCTLPIVAKINIGASGKGVQIFRDIEAAKSYIDQAFSNGIRQNWGPNMQMGGYGSRLLKLIKNPRKITKRITVYKKLYNEIQKGFVIFQEYVPHNYEWRIVKIGNSFFGHQKVKQGDKASGTKGIDYVLPPNYILDFVNILCFQNKFNSMSIDLFEDGKGGVLVNEMQTIFGHVQDYICEKNGIPGRILLQNKEWVFDPGNFNTNLSYDLRLEHALSLLKKEQ